MGRLNFSGSRVMVRGNTVTRAIFPRFNASIPGGERLPGRQWVCCISFLRICVNKPEKPVAVCKRERFLTHKFFGHQTEQISRLASLEDC
jgi:hypothetical protein